MKHQTKTPNQQLISFVVPVHNEEGNILPFIRELDAVMLQLPHYQYEILFVNDGSTDNSTAILDRLEQQRPAITHLEFSRNFGKEQAVSAGFHHVTGTIAISIDADLQHPLKLIPQFIVKWEQGADVVVGVRRQCKSDGIIRRWGSHWFYKIINQISETHIIPQSTDFRLVDRGVLDAFSQFSERGRLTRGLIDWLGFRREYIHFDADIRKNGVATYSTIQLFRLAAIGIVTFSLFPLRIAAYLGAFIMLFSGNLGIVMLLDRYVADWGMHFSGPAILADVILFLVGIVLVCLGLLAYYIGHIHKEVQGRPLYVIRRKRETA